MSVEPSAIFGDAKQPQESPDVEEDADETQDDVEENRPTIGAPTPSVGVFFSDEEIVGADADRILRSTLTRVVVIAGSPDSGKTTLVATLFDFFNEGPYFGYIFAASEALAGFERRCFESRMTSGLPDPTTERTRNDGKTRFLHLVVRDEDLNSPRQPLLFADISGEVFEQMQVNIEEIRGQTFIQRADHFTLLFDGGKIVDNKLRHQEKSGGVMLLRSLVQEKVVGRHTHVEIVFSRWDLVEDSDSRDRAHAFADGIRRDIDRDFRGSLGNLTFTEVAARPALGATLAAGHGLETLFLAWVRESPFLEQVDENNADAEMPQTLEEYLARYRPQLDLESR